MGAISDLEQFHAPNGWYSIGVPADWTAEADGSDTFLFYPAAGHGVLRVTALQVSGAGDATVDMAALLPEMRQGPGRSVRRAGARCIIHYQEDVVEAGGPMRAACWEVGEADKLLICHFAVAVVRWDQAATRAAIAQVQEMVDSLRIARR